MDYRNFEEVKTKYPVDTILVIRGKIILITGYHYDGLFWFPVNVVEGFDANLKEDFLGGSRFVY